MLQNPFVKPFRLLGCSLERCFFDPRVAGLADGSQVAAQDGLGSSFNQRLSSKVDCRDMPEGANCRDQHGADKPQNNNLDMRSMIGEVHRVIHWSVPAAASVDDRQMLRAASVSPPVCLRRPPVAERRGQPIPWYEGSRPRESRIALSKGPRSRRSGASTVGLERLVEAVD
jgi:hypothetical protein